MEIPYLGLGKKTAAINVENTTEHVTPKITCPLCADSRRHAIEERVWRGDMTMFDVAELLGVPQESVQEHMHEHIEAPEEEPTDDLAMLRTIMKKLNGVVSDLLVQPKGNYRSIAALVNNLRAIVETLAKIEGRLDDSIKIELQQNNMVMSQLTTFMLSKLCSSCAAEVATFLQELDLNMATATVTKEVST